MIGDRLTTDVFFGNDNNMATVYVHKFYHFWMNLKMNDFIHFIDQMHKKFWKIKKNINIKKFQKNCLDFYKHKTISRINNLLNQRIVNDNLEFINNHKVKKINNLLQKIK